QRGGFLLDGGHGRASVIPPVLCHMPVPEAWRFLLVLNRKGRGISGDPEDDAFAHLPQMDEDSAAEICRLVMMQVLPALAENDCAVFGTAITRVQGLVGRHFAGVQSGAYADPRVQDVLKFFSEHGATGIGQSSWGPTGFAIYPSETVAFHALRGARSRWPDGGSLDFVLCRAQNRPAEIHVDDALAGRIRSR
ncbi:MAG: GHMP kinase, partial [Gammaproteobacteria bacterium]